VNEYEVVLAYAGFAVVVFAAAMLWAKYQKALARRFHLGEYRNAQPHPHS